METSDTSPSSGTAADTIASSRRTGTVWVRWLAFGSCWAAILAAVPYARPLRKWLAGHLGDQFVLWLTVAFGVAAVAWALPRTLRRVDEPGRKLAWWIGVGAVLAAGGRGLGHAEWFHLVEYSALSVLAYRALSLHLRDAGVYLAAAGLTSFAGIVDEIVQWYTPGRVWDLRDVLLNTFIAVMIQILLWRGVEPAETSPAVGRRSLRIACLLWMATAALVLLCLFNPPEVVASYAGQVPLTDHIRPTRPAYRMTGGVETEARRRAAQGVLAASLVLLAWVHRRSASGSAGSADSAAPSSSSSDASSGRDDISRRSS